MLTKPILTLLAVVTWPNLMGKMLAEWKGALPITREHGFRGNHSCTGLRTVVTVCALFAVVSLQPAVASAQLSDEECNELENSILNNATRCIESMEDEGIFILPNGDIVIIGRLSSTLTNWSWEFLRENFPYCAIYESQWNRYISECVFLPTQYYAPVW